MIPSKVTSQEFLSGFNVKPQRTVTVGTSFLGRWFQGSLVSTKTDTLRKEGKILVKIETTYQRAVKTEVYANFPLTEDEIKRYLVDWSLPRGSFWGIS